MSKINLTNVIATTLVAYYEKFTGRAKKKKRTKSQKRKRKIILSAKLAKRRARLLKHQNDSFAERNLALFRLSPKVRVITPAARRCIKKGVLGKKGGLRI